MSTTAPPPTAPPESGPPPAAPEPGAFRALFSQKSGGLVTSLITTLVAFLVGGIVVLLTGSNPLQVYKGIFYGTGLDWFFPWVGGDERIDAAFNLQQTLLVTTTLILTGLAVAFAFRCGLFNIGGTGQWVVGATVSAWVGSSWAGMAGPAHIVLTIVLATLAGALWAGIAGILKATVGAHEVISTIMLNWIAIYTGMYLFGLGGPLQNDVNPSVPISNDVLDSAKLPVIWGDKELQGLHLGFLVAVLALVAYWLLLSRTTLGFRVRAVGRNPEAARYGGISVGRSYFMAMAISGGFAGLAGALDILGWQYRLGTLDIQFYQLGFVGIAVALLGRNTAVGVFFASLLFGALLYGTSTRSIDQSIIAPQLAGNLTTIIQALVLLFIGADVVILWLWSRRGRGLPRPRMPHLRTQRPVEATTTIVEAAPPEHITPAGPPVGERLAAWARAHVPRGMRAVGILGVALGVLAFWVAAPPLAVRTPVIPILIGLVGAGLGAWVASRGMMRLGLVALALSIVGGGVGVLATHSSVENLESVFVWSALTASMLRFATPLIFAAVGGMFSERSGVVNIGLEGMMLSGAFFGILGADRFGHWVWGVVCALIAGALIALIHAVVSIHWRADQIVSGTAINFLASGLTGYLFIDLFGPEGTPGGIPAIPALDLGPLKDIPFFGEALGELNLMIWLAFVTVIVAFFVMFRTPFGLRLRAVGEHPRAAETVGLSVYRIRYTAVVISGMLAAMGGAFLSIGFVNSFSEDMTAGAGFIALAALIFGNWRPKGLLLAALLFGLSSAIAQRLPVYSESAAILFETFPYVLTLVMIAGVIGRPRPPAAVGIPYKRS